jgi:hypothetical protein
MNNDVIWQARRLTKPSIWSNSIRDTYNANSEGTPQNRSIINDGSVDENSIDPDFYDNQIPGAYEISRSRMMSVSSRSWESPEIDQELNTRHESAHKYYITIFILVVVIILISTGIRFFVEANRKSIDQDQNQEHVDLCKTLGQMPKALDPFQYCVCAQVYPDIDDEFWKIYNVVKSTRGIAEYVTDDDPDQACSATNLAILWIAWELRDSLNHNVYIDFESIQSRIVLVILYFSWSGSNWINQSGWLSNKTVCEWYGVGCDSQSNVVQLVLRRNNLRGTLESRLSMLHNLRSLDLVYNSISGSIPSELWSLPLLGKKIIMGI